LQSGNDKAVETALLAISILGDKQLATELAGLYRTNGANAALSKIVNSIEDALSIARSSIDIVVPFNNNKWKRYQEPYEGYGKTIQRGVLVRYIVLADNISSVSDKHLLENLRNYLRSGINIRIVPAKSSSSNKLHNYLIIDNKLLIYERESKSGHFIEWIASQDINEVESANQSFETLWSESIIIK
jgi:hypothetical protein